MSALVGYGSSDEEEVDDVRPEKPAKVARLDNDAALQQANEDTSGKRIGLGEARRTGSDNVEAHTAIPSIDNDATKNKSYEAPEAAPASAPRPDHDEQGPRPRPSPAPPVDDTTISTSPTSGPTSPYTTERLLIRNLTMPPIPNFDIPDEPPPPPPNSEAAATLAARTKKFEHFLALKKKGVHFNQRLQDSSSLRNPGLLPNLMEFAGVSREESYASAIPVEFGGVPGVWPEAWGVEDLVRGNERRLKRERAGRQGVEFVSGAKGKSEIANGGGKRSKEGTPGSSTGGRKSRPDER
ncbi:hypothetical protein LTR86_005121 [Recurvomyces mirabilis]|nr:hypothetical protein LTR86_005121 [Recurvomyces mirabilis]